MLFILKKLKCETPHTSQKVLHPIRLSLVLFNSYFMVIPYSAEYFLQNSFLSRLNPFRNRVKIWGFTLTEIIRPCWDKA